MEAPQYALGRGYASSARLNLAHFLWTTTTGYLLHRCIPAPHEGSKIADVGTGTGIWLFDLSDELPPSCVLDGFDISDEQFSPSAWLPNNVSLQVWNALEDPALEFCGQYDIVHVRLFMSIIQDNDPRSLINNCRQLLSVSFVILSALPEILY
ncbi:hypothetical protein DL98DRAFT_188097 [Cadophora sp. DSE1049]|nr:hypothetical protein DL98DRAFT_188097 [Cadophora sp. DSE1049]